MSDQFRDPDEALGATWQSFHVVYGPAAGTHYCTCEPTCVRRLHREALCPTCYECRCLRDDADQRAARDQP